MLSDAIAGNWIGEQAENGRQPDRHGGESFQLEFIGNKLKIADRIPSDRTCSI
jgi:hypothetical protein